MSERRRLPRRHADKAANAQPTSRINPFDKTSGPQFFNGENVPTAPPKDNFNNIIEGAYEVDPKSLKKVDKIISTNRKIVIGILIAALFILGVSFAVFMAVSSNIKNEYGAKQAETSNVAPTQKAPAKTEDNSKDIKGQNNPVSASTAAFVDKPGEVLVTQDGNNALSFSVNNQVKHHVVFPTISDKITMASTGCDLKDVAANCFLGSAKANNKDVQIYGFRDAKASSLLYTSVDPQSVDAQGAAMAYIVPVDNGDNKTYALVVVFDDETGFMVTSTDSSLLTSIANDSGKHMVIQ